MNEPRRIRTYREVADPGAEDIARQVVDQRRRIDRRLESVDRLVLVASGKGGVGKSALTANLATLLAGRGWRVGALDGDLNGPSLARMLGASSKPLEVTEAGVRPAEGILGTRVISTDLLLDPDAPVAWRQPETGGFIYQSTLESGVLREFLSDVAWGELDLLLVDLPPGTDKLARILEIAPPPDLLLLVTTPAGIARRVVARSAAAVEGVPRVALVANMTHVTCGACGQRAPLYAADGARLLADETGLPLWAEIPFDPELATATDRGRPLAATDPDAPAVRALATVADRIGALPVRRTKVAG